MKALPYFKWFPADADSDLSYSLMTNEELGYYHRLLNFSWKSGGVPADPKARAKALHQNQKAADRLWVSVGKCFVPDHEDPNKLVNPRLERERVDALQKSEASRKSVRTRYERTTNVPTNVAGKSYERNGTESTNVPTNVLPRAFVSVSEVLDLEVSSKTPLEPETPEANLASDGIERKKTLERIFDEQFWPQYPRKTAKAAAKKTFTRHAESTEHGLRICTGLERLLPNYRKLDPQFVPHATTFINQRRYEDEPESISAPAPRMHPRDEVQARAAEIYLSRGRSETR